MIDNTGFSRAGSWWYNSSKRVGGSGCERPSFRDTTGGFTCCVSRLDEGAQDG